jgi:heme exporter protein B
MLMVVGLLLYFAFSIFTIDPVQNRGLFFITILFGAIGISTCFTFVASILSTQNSQSTMMAILSLPLIIPILLLLINLSANALGILDDTSIKDDLILLGGIDFVLFGLAVMIFPVIWRS